MSINYNGIINVALLLIEMHLNKFVCIFAFYLALVDIGGVHLGIVVLAMLASICRRRMQVKLCALISLLIGVLVVLKMIFQMQNTQMDWDLAKCTVNEQTTVSSRNHLPWLGFRKQSADHPLHHMLSMYLMFLAMSTLYFIVQMNQMRQRLDNVPQITELYSLQNISNQISEKSVDRPTQSCIRRCHSSYGR